MIRSKIYKKGITFLLVSLLVCTLYSPMVLATETLNGVGPGNSSTSTTTVVPNEPQSSTNENTNQGNVQNENVGSSTQNTESATGIPAMPGSTQSEEDVMDTAGAIGGMFNEVGPDANDIAVANSVIEPIAKVINLLMGVILGITSLLLMFVTVLDLLYMAFPPVRDALDGGQSGMANMAGGRGMGRGMNRGMGMGMNRGMGMGGMGGMGMNGMGGMGGMGMNGMGGAGMGQQQQVGGGLSAVGRFVSDEAIAACMETQGGAMGQGPVKSMLFSYMKKRALFLILFGVCVILFTSTVFTDLGIRIGTWALSMFMGL